MWSPGWAARTRAASSATVAARSVRRGAGRPAAQVAGSAAASHNARSAGVISEDDHERVLRGMFVVVSDLEHEAQARDPRLDLEVEAVDVRVRLRGPDDALVAVLLDLVLVAHGHHRPVPGADAGVSPRSAHHVRRPPRGHDLALGVHVDA